MTDSGADAGFIRVEIGLHILYNAYLTFCEACILIFTRFRGLALWNIDNRPALGPELCLTGNEEKIVTPRQTPTIHVLLSITVLLTLTGALSAVTINVPGDQSTIQDGINAAVSNADEVVVAPGTYPEAIDFMGKSITVRASSSDPNVTIIHPPANQHGVQFINGEDPNAVLYGFTITGADLNGLSFPDNRGGGIYVVGSAPAITRCIISNNQNAQFGGGIAIVDDSDATITDCIIDNNLANTGNGIFMQNSSLTMHGCTLSNNQGGFLAQGGGMYNSGSDLTITQCTFINNLGGTFSNGEGGGILNINSTLSISDSVFSTNEALQSGGGIHQSGTGDLIVSHCHFDTNSALVFGGGIYFISSGILTLEDSTFLSNTVENQGGGVYCSTNNASSSISRCTFQNNETLTSVGGGLALQSTPFPINECDFIGNRGSLGGGAYVFDNSSSAFTNCNFIGNIANGEGGGIYNEGTISEISHCSFDQNIATTRGGAISNLDSSTPITHVILTSNSADTGGGIYNLNSDGVSVTSALFSGNTATGDGGGIYNSSSDIAMLHCTLSHNTAADGGGAFNSGSSPTITNSIIALNDPNGLADNGGVSTITYSNIQGGFAGAGNIDSDPMFVDADGADNVMGTADDDLRLLAGSLSIDAGDSPHTVGAGLTTDLDGSPRGVDGSAANTGIPVLGTTIVVDMGAYEVPNPCDNALEGDINCDGVVNELDFALMALHWLETL
jgi:predicted outer membrane repeat protein